MGHVVWSVREGAIGEFDAPEILGGYRSANRVHEPRLGDVLELPVGSGPWRVVDWAVADRADAPGNVLLVESVGSGAASSARNEWVGGAWRILSVDEVAYRYELRRASDVVATGHLSREEPLEVGASLEIGGYHGIVRTIEPQLGAQEMLLVVQLLGDH